MIEKGTGPSMKKCPKCGYIRRAIDDEFTNAPPNACPKCFSLYDEEPISEDEVRTDPNPPTLVMTNEPGRKTIGKNPYLLIAVTAAVAVLATLYLTSWKKPAVAPQQNMSPPGILLPGEPGGSTSNPAGAPLSISEIASRVGPSVVSILVYNQNRELVGRASGFFIGNNGHVVTNYHALKGSYSSEIKTARGKTYPINNVVAEDSANDLIMVSTAAHQEDINPLHISSNLPQVGEKIVVIGNPLGLEQTVSDGIVSAFRVKDTKTVIQITAPISPGSSGSPVVNMRGEVIGVAFMQLVGGQNLNFCIPGDRLSSLGSQPGYAMADFTAQSLDKLYCYLDENKRVRFIKNPDSIGPKYVSLTTPDGAPDKERFEKWVFEILGGNPYKIDPQAEVDAERERLPEHFRRMFPGYEMEQLGRFAPAAQAYWGTWVANRLQRIFDQAARARQEGITQHRQLMETFEQVARR